MNAKSDHTFRNSKNRVDVLGPIPEQINADRLDIPPLRNKQRALFFFSLGSLMTTFANPCTVESCSGRHGERQRVITPAALRDMGVRA